MKEMFTEINLIVERFFKKNENNIHIYIKNNYLYSLL